MTFYGSSFIAGPTGELVAELGRTEEGVITAAFDLDEICRGAGVLGPVPRPPARTLSRAADA